MNNAETKIIEDGYQKLSAEELKQRIGDKTIRGDYYNGRKYIVFINRDGTMEGKNDIGTHSFGDWSVNMKDNSFTVIWDSYWDNTTSRAYDVDGEIKFFDSRTCQWRTTFKKFEDGRRALKI